MKKLISVIMLVLVFVCSGCQQSGTLTANSSVPQVCNHNFAPATCIAPETCTICGETRGTIVDHNWSGGSCTTPRKCTVCGKENYSDTGHRWAPPKSIDDDYTQKCTRCGRTLTERCNHQFNADSDKCQKCGIFNMGTIIDNNDATISGADNSLTMGIEKKKTINIWTVRLIKGVNTSPYNVRATFRFYDSDNKEINVPTHMFTGSAVDGVYGAFSLSDGCMITFDTLLSVIPENCKSFYLENLEIKCQDGTVLFGGYMYGIEFTNR